MRAYGAGCSTPSRRFSFSANQLDGRIAATAIVASTTNEQATRATAHQRVEPLRRSQPDAERGLAFGLLPHLGRRIRLRSRAGNVGIGVSVTLALSVSGITVRATLIAGLAIVALLLTGWRKPARAEPRSPRGVIERGLCIAAVRRPGVVVDHVDAPEYHRPGPVRRLLAAVASGGIGLLFGVLTAIVVSFGIAMAVIWLTDLLQQ